jgi:FtsZ-binding cell division protein ZapB
MSLVFIPEQTKVVLIGTSEFPEDGNLKSIKPIEANISKLGELFSNENIFGIDKTNVVSLLNKKDYEILEELENQAQQAIDTLIIYYAGHGEREKGKTLYLTATNTKKERLISTAIEFERFNKIIQSSKAKKKFLILDCCYSGLAALNSDNNPFFENELEDVQGTYIITSSPSNSVSFFHDNSTYTFFTSEFISILENGLDSQTAFIELGEMYNIIGQNLKRKSCPSPMQKNTLSGSNGQLFFANNFKYLEYSKKS